MYIYRAVEEMNDFETDGTDFVFVLRTESANKLKIIT